MKILDVKSLAIAEVKVIKYQRFGDERGYFTETYRKNDFDTNPQTSFLKDLDFTQANESFSKKGVIRGLHLQWNPYMVKLVRVVTGRVIDLALDIRIGSPTFGKAVGYELKTSVKEQSGEWVFVPVGFAHGLVFLEEGIIEYFCSGQWAPETEAGISPLAPDIDWSLFDQSLKVGMDNIISKEPLISDKDKNGHTISSWKDTSHSQNFVYLL